MKKVALLVFVIPLTILVSCGGEVICDYVVPERPAQQTIVDPSLQADDKNLAPTNTDQSNTLSEPVNKEENTPRIVKLGRDNCLPCIQMNEILGQVRSTVGTAAVVEIIDVGQNPDAAYQYGIKVIPTEIIFDAKGNEIFRFEGVMQKEEVLDWLKKGGARF